jgi:Domain of unknown function (DUF5666)
MNSVSFRGSRRQISVSLLTWALLVALATTFMAGCGGGGSKTTLTGNTAVTLLASSTANDQLSELTLNITGVTLTNKEGKSVTLLTTPQYIEFMHLNGGVEPLATVSVPEDVYTSATVSANFGIPLCNTYDPSTGDDGTFSVLTASASDVTANLPAPITVTGTGMGLELNLQVSKSTNYTSCPGIVNGAVPFSYTPTFNVTPVAFAAEPTNSANGKATGLRGLVGSVTANGGSFSVTGDFGAGVSGPTWQVSSKSSTVFQGITGASQLATGMPVDIDVAIQADGTVVATRIAVYDANLANLSYSTGPVTYVAAPIPGLFALATDNQGPDFLGFDGGNFSYNFGNAVFQISGQMPNVSTLPFTAAFDGANLVPGQNIFVTMHSGLNGPIPVSTITLLPQTINGTVSAISSSGNFTTYTISLAPYDLFPNLAVQPEQANLLTEPGSVVVYADSNTQMLNSAPAAVGSVLRFNGLVFNDNGTLRMDCGQVNDGVAE